MKNYRKMIITALGLCAILFLHLVNADKDIAEVVKLLMVYLGAQGSIDLAEKVKGVK